MSQEEMVYQAPVLGWSGLDSSGVQQHGGSDLLAPGLQDRSGPPRLGEEHTSQERGKALKQDV